MLAEHEAEVLWLDHCACKELSVAEPIDAAIKLNTSVMAQASDIVLTQGEHRSELPSR